MTIKDLKPGMKCTILCTKQDKSFENPVRIEKVRSEEVLTDAIVVNGKVVSIDGVSSFLIVNIENKAPECFQYIKPMLCRDKVTRKAYYKINLKNAKTRSFNRRKNSRCPIGAEVNVRADDNNTTYPCELKDISATGFALVFTGANIPKDYGKIRTFHCLYNDFDPKIAFGATLSLTGMVKRCVHLDNNRILFGCQFNKSKEVERYVSQKMMHRQKAAKR